MIGIYKFTNLLNGKCYIGQSIDIEQRRLAHLSSANNKKADDYNHQLHQALRKYGVSNFSFEVLVELHGEGYDKELLNTLEIYYISKYNSFKQGYNATPGGDARDPALSKGEKNGRALVTEKDVLYIRECYNAHIPFKEIQKKYKNHQITTRGLQKIWYFETWKDIKPEYNTEENKYWHSHKAKANESSIARDNKRHFSENQIRQFRDDFYNKQMTIREIQIKYNLTERTSTIRNAVIGKTYKDIK